MAILVIAPALVKAQSVTTQEYVPYRGNEISRINPLDSGDKTILQEKRDLVNDLAQRELGRSLNGSVAHDLRILQELLDREIVTADQRVTLQAMGVVLGDLYARQAQFKWVSYGDELGKSLAIQIGKTGEVLFPLTMISRRVEVGIEVDVREIYEKGLSTARAIEHEDDLEQLD
ncbi:MAG: DUF3806 domain-containing protein [Halioglobus sp.]|nr:DUF3806 domain-containing protein [Halioglobus sp.]